VLVVRSTKVTAPMFEASDSLGLVVRAGAGVNTIDIGAASRRAVLVSNCPGRNATAVAELTFALILALDRRLVENTNDLRRGVWNKTEYAKARGLKDRTLGIIGLGPIGRLVAERAQAFEMGVVAWSRSLSAAAAKELGVLACGSPAEVASRCDILTVHLAAAPETKKIINAEVLSRLQPGSYVINTARAEVIDYDALLAAVKEKGLRVGLDVYPGEPAGGEGNIADAILAAGSIVYGTHHIGASTEQAQAAIAAETVNIVREYLRTGRVKNCVNLCARSPAKYMLVVRHRNRPGVLAHTLHAISHAGVNVEEMENVICEGAESACAQIKLDAPLAEPVLAQIKTGNEHVFAVTLGQITNA
jgi:D-3-phosphoglycerate dehydrogenase